jgi:hypothetical protein
MYIYYISLRSSENEKRFRENVSSKNRAIYEMMFQNMVESDRPQVTI